MSKRRARETGTSLSKAFAPNDLRCADFKGEFKLGNGRYCYPRTVTRGLALPPHVRSLETLREDVAVTDFERLFAGGGGGLATAEKSSVSPLPS